MTNHLIKSFGVTLAVSAASALGSPVIDGINIGAVPARSADTVVQFGSNTIGWYYTPSFSYDLDGINGLFQAMGSATTAVDLTKTVTVQIQSERPVNGGVVLGQGDFTIRTLDGGNLGGTFAPVHLTAGTKYFVDFLNVQNVGINLATWQNDANGKPQPAGGATVNLGGYYGNLASATDFASVGPAYGISGNVNVAGGESILFFSGVIVPEPTSMVALLSTGVLLLKRTKRRFPVA